MSASVPIYDERGVQIGETLHCLSEEGPAPKRPKRTPTPTPCATGIGGSAKATGGGLINLGFVGDMSLVGGGDAKATPKPPPPPPKRRESDPVDSYLLRANGRQNACESDSVSHGSSSSVASPNERDSATVHRESVFGGFTPYIRKSMTLRKHAEKAKQVLAMATSMNSVCAVFFG